MKKIITIAIIFQLANIALAQNFGIDQPSPTEKLDVNGNIKAAGSIGAGGNVRISTSGDAKFEYFGSSSDRGFVGWQSTVPVGVHLMNRDNSPIYFGTTNTERMRIDAVGNVGIGTVSPLRKLEVNNAMRFTNSSADANDGVIGTAPFAPGLNIVGINTDGGGRKVSWWGSFLQQENPVGNTFVGTSTFTGQIKIQGGSPAAGHVLTSDATGLASWAAPSSTGIKNVSGTVSTYTIGTRYYVKGTYGTDAGRTVSLDMNIVAELCGDEDGCRMRFNMRYWSGFESELASDGSGHPSSYLFSYDISNGRWRLGGTSGIDGNGSTQHIISIFSGACYFTDGSYSGFSDLGDPSGRQLGLLIWNGAYPNAARTCELTLED